MTLWAALTRRYLPAGLLAMLLTACHEKPPLSAEYFVFGTLLEVSVAGVDRRTAKQAYAALQQAFQQMHRDWHAWEPGALMDVNQAFARGQRIQTQSGIIALIRQSQDIERRTAGRFNPAIGGLIGLWGFHTSEFPVIGPPPRSADIEALLKRKPSTLDIEINDGQVFSVNSSVQLDFGGIAKGYAVDLARQILLDHGINDAIINAGGDLRAFGQNGQRPWRIAIRNPLGGVLGSLEISGDEAVFTSGNYERYRQDDKQQRYPHIIDPRTGYPASGVLAVTIIADEGALADAAATALVVAGLTEWPEVAAPLGIDKVLLTDEKGRVFATPAMLERVELTDPGSAVAIQIP